MSIRWQGISHIYLCRFAELFCVQLAALTWPRALVPAMPGRACDHARSPADRALIWSADIEYRARVPGTRRSSSSTRADVGLRYRGRCSRAEYRAFPGLWFSGGFGLGLDPAHQQTFVCQMRTTITPPPLIVHCLPKKNALAFWVQGWTLSAYRQGSARRTQVSTMLGVIGRVD